jgi:hypothetical protein
MHRVRAELLLSGADRCLSRVPHGLQGEHTCPRCVKRGLSCRWRVFPESLWPCGSVSMASWVQQAKRESQGVSFHYLNGILSRALVNVTARRHRETGHHCGAG